MADHIGHLGGVPHDFFRDAADVHAGAANDLSLDQRAGLAVHGGAVDGGDTAAAGADGDVVVVPGHQ